VKSAITADHQAVPVELAGLRQWVAWRWEDRDGKLTKPPLNPHTGEYASTTNAATWGILEDALRFRLHNPSAAGLGFVFTKDDPYAGVDLDKCRDPETGEIAPWAQTIIDYLRSYTEVSPSGTGVKIFIQAALPAGIKKGAVEAYDSGRYFTVTGDHVAGTPRTIEDRPAQLQALHVWLKADEPIGRPVSPPTAPVDLDDATLIEKARTAANGVKFERLWSGDWSDYPSQSEADLALCSHLAFWTGGDGGRVNRLFRQSGLYRAKWDQPHFADGRTYGAETVDTAIRRAGAFYSTGFGRAIPPPSNGHHRPPILARFPRTDSGNAELFASLFGDQLRFDHRRNRWLLWTDHWWKPDVDEEVLRLAKEAVRRRYQIAPDLFDDPDEFKAEAKWAVASESRMRLEAALALAQAERPIADSGEGWDADPWLLAVANGVVDLRTGALRGGRPDDRITMHSPVCYVPEAVCPRWLAFLREVFGDDDELIDFIRRACAYSLTGLTNEECHFCFGSGCNGEGTFNRVQRDILGDYAANTAFSTLEMSSRNSIPNDLAALYGKRLVTASELNEAVRLNEARMKMLAGQDPVTARFLHSEYFTFVPNAKFWLAVNHKPIVNDDSTGFWRKIRLIPFTQCFEGRADRNLKDALRAEYSGILAWMVDGCLEWQRRGLDPPPSVRAATEQYRAESDPIAEFLRDRCATDPELTARAGELYLAYQSWALKQGLREREQLTATRFGRLMGQRFPKDSDRDGTFYQGVTLRPPEANNAR
jgi:putative DNA primase/helicase